MGQKMRIKGQKINMGAFPPTTGNSRKTIETKYKRRFPSHEADPCEGEEFPAHLKNRPKANPFICFVGIRTAIQS